MAAVTTADRPGTIVNVPLPGLGALPTLSAGGLVNTQYQEREDAVRRAAARVRALREFREAVHAALPEERPGERIREVRVTFQVDRSRCSALEEWIAGGVGGRRVVRRVGGPLPLDSRSVRGLGSGVGLLALTRALTKALDV